MKNKSIKSILTLLVCSVLCFVGAIALTFAPRTAQAVTTSENVAIVDGASLRVDGDFGLRFKTTVNADYFEDGMEVHTLLIPTAMLGGAELTADTTSAIDFKLDNAKKYQIENDYYFNTVLTDIPATEYGTEISVRAYVKNGADLVYSALSTSKSVATVSNGALEFNFDAYKDSVADYLVKDVTMLEELSIGTDKSYDLNAIVEYNAGTSAEVKAKLDQIYTVSYSSNNEQVATVDANGKITTLKEGEATITATVNGIDGVTATCVVTVADVKVPYGEVFDFNNIDVSKVKSTWSTISSGEESGRNALIITHEATTASTLIANIELPANYFETFDYVTMEAKGNRNAGAGFWGGWKAMDNANISYVTPTSRTFKSSEFHQVSLNKDGELVIYHTTNTINGYGLTMYIYSIGFGFNDITVEENATVDLTERFSVSDTELTNVTFNGSDVSDVTAFKPTASGTLTFTIEKEGFIANTFSLDVNYERKLAYNKVYDFAAFDTSKITGHAKEITKGSDANGDYVQFQLGSGGMFCNFVVDATEFDRINSFEKLTLKSSWGDKGTFNFYTILSSGSQKNINCAMAKDTLTESKMDRTSVDGVAWVNSTYPSFKLVSWAHSTCYVKVYDIELGYGDIAADNGNNSTINLLTEFGLSAGELTGVKFDGADVSNVTAFTPSKSGTLTFTVEKEGFKATDFSVNVNYTMKQTYNVVYDMASIDTTKISGNAKNISKGSDANGNYVQLDVINGGVIDIAIDSTEFSRINSFDWLKVKWVRSNGYANGSVNGYVGAASNSINVGGLVKDSLVESKFDRVAAGKAGIDWVSSSWAKIRFANWGGDSTFKIYSIEMGFNDITTDGTQYFDLTALFRVNASELTDVKFNGNAVSDLTAFNPTESGTLTFNIAKDGYKVTAFSVNVTKA